MVIWHAALSPNDWVSFKPAMIGLDENQFLGHELCQLRRFRTFSNFDINPTMTVSANWYGFFCSACGIGIRSKARFFQEDLDFSLKFAVALARLLDARGPDRFVLMMQRLAQWRLVGLRQAKFPEPHEHREVAAHRQFVDLAPQGDVSTELPLPDSSVEAPAENRFVTPQKARDLRIRATNHCKLLDLQGINLFSRSRHG